MKCKNYETISTLQKAGRENQVVVYLFIRVESLGGGMKRGEGGEEEKRGRWGGKGELGRWEGGGGEGNLDSRSKQPVE